MFVVVACTVVWTVITVCYYSSICNKVSLFTVPLHSYGRCAQCEERGVLSSHCKNQYNNILRTVAKRGSTVALVALIG